MQQPKAVLIKTSLVDYPERVAAACFLRGCNLRCPYCYNTELVAPGACAQAQDAGGDNRSQAQSAAAIANQSQAQESGAQAKRDEPQFVSIQDIIAHLKKRANVLSGFVISGGEPLLKPDAVRGLILEACSLGYKIKLDTNGMFPGRLQELLSDPACAPDYVALDVKTNPARYSELQAQDAGGYDCSQDLNAAPAGSLAFKASQAQESGAQAKRDEPQFVFIQDIIAHLKKRANVLSGFVISGGEPLCQPDIVRQLILEARSLGYKIKLDTNGAFPGRLQELLSDPACAPDYVALDVKTAPARYSELQAQDAATVKAFQDLNAGGQDCSQDQEAAAQKIVESIKIVSALPAAAREFRTVLYPPLVGQAEIKEIAKLLPKDARWFFAHFLNGHCLSAAAEKVQPYTEEKEAALLELARSFIPGAELR